MAVVTLTAASGTWTVPSNVSSLSEVILIGAGGRGASITESGGGGGGGGGASVVVTNYSVTPGQNISYSVGQSDGASTWFVSSSTFLAVGGSNVNTNSTTGGQGGQASSCIGPVKYSGGNGADASGTYGGGGGSAAGLAAGNSATDRIGAASPGAPAGGGGSGASSSGGTGNFGGAYGGASGGAYANNPTDRISNPGTTGVIQITYFTDPLLLIGNGSISVSSSGTLSVTSSAPRLYWVIYPSSKTPPADDATGRAQIIAGLDGDGDPAVDANWEEAPGSSGQFDFAEPATGLTPAAGYRISYLWYNPATTAFSNVVTTAEIVTESTGLAELAGAATITLAASAALTREVTLSSAAAISISATGAVVQDRPLAAAAAIILSAAGNATTQYALQGTVGLAFSSSAALSVEAPNEQALQGGTAIALSAAGAVSVVRNLTATPSIALIGTGTLDVQTPAVQELAGFAQVSIAGAADLFVEPPNIQMLASSASLDVGATGNATATFLLVGAAPIVVGAAGTLSDGNEVLLTGGADLVVVGLGALSIASPIVGIPFNPRRSFTRGTLLRKGGSSNLIRRSSV